MLFRFAPAGWLGIHLGMTGRLRVDEDGADERLAATQEATRHTPARHPRHDHLVLRLARRRLVFSDPRLFGRVRFHAGAETPPWWRDLPPEILSNAFTEAWVAEFLRRRARSPIKAVLLMQDRFPGIGNWMADEVLWRAGIHPRARAGALSAEETRRLRRELRAVSRVALRSLSEEGRELPRGWLFHRRWDDGGSCPRTGVPLVRETIGGRTTCWSPGRQRPGRTRSARAAAGGAQGERKRRTSS
jgi:formamidopyrimidine-DNA glycosylase